MICVVRSRRAGLCCLLWLALWGWTAAVADEPAQQDEALRRRVVSLMRQLGDPSFVRREQASEALLQIGIAVKPYLVAAERDSDAEIRFRAQRLLAIVENNDFENRLAAFEADKDGGRDYGLPGWKRYRETAGAGQPARRLFVEMLRAESPLMRAAEIDATSTGRLLDDRCEQLYADLRGLNAALRMQMGFPPQISTGSVAALLFVGATPQVAVSSRSVAYVNQFCSQSEIRQTLADPAASAPLLRLMAGWIRCDWDKDPNSLHMNLNWAMQYNIAEGIEPAIKAVGSDAVPARIKQTALLAVGRFGGKEHLPVVEPLLGDSTVCSTTMIGRNKMNTELRDVALLVMVRLSNQDPRAYGYSRLQPNTTTLYMPQSIGFSTTQSREAALAKWKEWAAANR